MLLTPGSGHTEEKIEKRKFKNTLLGNLMAPEGNPIVTLGRSDKKRGHEGLGPLTCLETSEEVLPQRMMRFARPS